jgi:hypothetical protein
VEPHVLRDLEIAFCVGCFGCWERNPGECLVDDAARDLARAMIQSELVVYLTPVTFGGYSSQLKKAVDRVICLLHPHFTKVHNETHHIARCARYPRLLGVGGPRSSGCTSLFSTAHTKRCKRSRHRSWNELRAAA